MAAADDDAGQEQPKASKRDQWRGKFKEKANKLTKAKPLSLQRDQDVADFLRPGSSSTSASTEHLSHPPQLQQQAQQPPQQYLQHPQPPPQFPQQQQPSRPNAAPPRIDTGATEQWSSAAPEDRLEPLGFPAPRPIAKRHPKPPGLRVSFSDRAPEIIGEGGDESELPANQVVGSWHGPTDQGHGGMDGSGHSLEPLEPPDVLKIGAEGASKRSSLQRAPTRARAGTGWEQRRLSMSMEEGLVQAKKEDLLDTSAPLLPEPTIPKLDFDLDNAVVPIEDKPYIARKQSVAQSNGKEGAGANFLAYNPSIRIKSGPPGNAPPVTQPVVNKSSPEAIDAEYMPDFGAPSTSMHSPDTGLATKSHREMDGNAKVTTSEPTPASPPAQSAANRALDRPVEEGNAISPEAEAAEEFFTRMQHMRGSFKLTSERPRAALSGACSQWLRAGVWWFLKGRFELEEGLRALQVQSGPTPLGGEGLPLNKQCYINLTKSWWIMNEVLPQIMQSTNEKSAPSDGLDSQQMIDAYNRTRWEISRFFLSLKRRQLFPPPALLVQGADPEIWMPYPALPAGLYAMAASLNPRTLTRNVQIPVHLAFGMPLGDSDTTFSYGRFFGFAQFLGDSELSGHGGFHCMVSVVREHTETLAEFLMATQDGQLNLHVQAEKARGPTYSDLRWTTQPNTIVVKLTSDVRLGIQLREPDFRFLHNVNDYNHMLEAERYAKVDEELLYGDVVRAFHFMNDSREANKSGFPTTPVLGCKVRLFQKNTTLPGSGGREGAVGTGGVRSAFNGYRLTVTSPTESKTLSSLTRHLPGTRPILFNNLRGDGGAPALALVLQEDSGSLASLIFTFQNAAKRAAFHTILAGTATSPDECFSEDIPLQSLEISEAGHGQSRRPLPHGIQWQRLRVINAGQNLDDASCVGSERLRVCISCNYGSLTDRINLGSGELRMGLDPDDTTALKLWRPAQNNLTLAFTEGTVRSKDRALLEEALMLANSAPSIRIYRFTSLPVLHDFQALVTGFEVAYDGAVSSFSILRRRALVHKQVEAEHARIQVLRETSSDHNATGGQAMLVAFFKDFAAGKCLGAVLSSKDTYEGLARGGKFYVRLVEAIFGMPRSPDEEGSDLVCLDSPQAMNEHEDLVLAFDNEDERDLFARALPASIAKASRMANFRR